MEPGSGVCISISPVFYGSQSKTKPREVKTVTDCHKLFNDPRVGELEFDHVNLQVSECPDLKLMIYTASTDTAEKLGQQIYSGKGKDRSEGEKDLF